jgi:hypothetical protein
MQVAACWRTRWLEGTGRVVPNILISFAFRGLTSMARSLALLCTAEVAWLTVQPPTFGLTPGTLATVPPTNSEIRLPWLERDVVLTWQHALYYRFSSSITRQDPCVFTSTCTNISLLMEHYVCSVTFRFRQ